MSTLQFPYNFIDLMSLSREAKVLSTNKDRSNSFFGITFTWYNASTALRREEDEIDDEAVI